MREVGRGNGMEERSLEIGEVLRGGEEMMETGSRFTHILEKGSGNLSRLSDNESKLATNKTLGCGRVKLNMIYTLSQKTHQL